MSRISFEGINNQFATFESSGTVRVGDLVSINSSGKIVAAVENDGFFGICTNKRDTIVTVQINGYAVVPTSDIDEYGIVKAIYNSDGELANGEETDAAPLVKVVKVYENSVGILF